MTSSVTSSVIDSLIYRILIVEGIAVVFKITIVVSVFVIVLALLDRYWD